MKCIFESNLYNNPTHNRHILREMLEEPGMDEFRELEADGPSDAELDAIEHGDETAGEVDIPDEEDPTMRLGHGEDSTVRDYVERESPEAIAAFSEDELNQLVRDVDIKEINNKIAAFMSGQMESCCVMASNLLGRQGYGSAILREDYQLQSMLSVEGNPQYEEPEVKKEPKPKAPTLTAKRNRRLRSKTRNIQLWNNKKKCFDPKYINTRFTKMSDANDAIKRIGESMEDGDDVLPPLCDDQEEYVQWLKAAFNELAATDPNWAQSKRLVDKHGKWEALARNAMRNGVYTISDLVHWVKDRKSNQSPE